MLPGKNPGAEDFEIDATQNPEILTQRPLKAAGSPGSPPVGNLLADGTD